MLDHISITFLFAAFPWLLAAVLVVASAIEDVTSRSRGKIPQPWVIFATSM